jgi:hypothetical protein
MKLAALFAMARSGRLGLLLSTTGAMRASYRLAFLAALVESGLLPILANGPVPLARIITALGAQPAMRDGLEAWLDLGVWLGELRRKRDWLRLRGNGVGRACT